MIKLGRTARYLRETKGLSQRRAASLLGISPVHLCNIENNKSSPSNSLLDRYRELWSVDLYILAWCLHGDVDALPAAVREPMKELAAVWRAELGELLEDGSKAS